MTAAVPSAQRRWMMCGLLLLASAINYMDRQTLANTSTRITREFALTNEQYGNLEAWFAYAFAAGSLCFGVLADRVSLRRLYAIVVALWSCIGLITGFSQSYDQLLICRALLGFVEGGHWPCGVKATRLLLEARDRSLGNGVLQSGTSIGAIITPLMMRAFMTPEDGSWRIAFQVIGAIGLGWIVLWFWLVRKDDFPAPAAEAPADRGDRRGFAELLLSRRMFVIIAVIACINTTWQIMRAWLPKFLQEGRGWQEDSTLHFTAFWFAATDVGCLGAGAMAVWLARRGMAVTRARLIVFYGCGLLCATCALAPWLGRDGPLMLVLMIAGAGCLGLFPLYHAFTQDISASRQGRITGVASVAAWVLPGNAQRLFGWLADRTGSFDTGLTIAAFLPLVAGLILAVAWRKEESTQP